MSELATIRAQFDAAVGDSSDLVIFFDPHGTIRHASGACRSLPGIEASELVGRNALDLIHRDDQERMFAEFTSIPNLGDHVRAEFRIEDTRGNVLWLEQIATNFLDDPDCGYIVANLRDITDRVLAEEAIRQLSAIVECSRDAIFSSSCTGVITTWNAGAAGLFGYTGAEMIGCDVNDLFPIDGDEDVRHVFDEALHGAAVDNVGTRGHHADGTSVSVSISVSPIRSRSGEISGTSTIVRDETERDELLQRIEGVHRRLAEAQASAKLGSFEVDLVTGTVTRSDELCRILGLRPGSSSGMGLDSVHPDDRDRARELVGEAAAGRHNAEIALLHRATYDSLTEVLNRASLHDRLRSALSVPDTGHVVALAVIDIDGFKLLNEVAGHSIGDHSLQALAQRLLAGLRTTDLVARVGGDEFAVVRLDARCLDDAERLGMDVMNLLEAPLVLPDREVVLRYSIGVTLSTKTDTPEALLRDAEDAMYQAKREGGSQAIVFDHQARTRAQRRQSVAVALPHALEHDELHLQYQPIVSLATRVVAGFESLLRWKHPHLGTISPDEFIPIAETTGQILPIGAWALDHAPAPVGCLAVRSTASSKPVDGDQRFRATTGTTASGRSHKRRHRPGWSTGQRSAPRDHRERLDGSRRQGTPHDCRDEVGRIQREHRRLRDRVLLAELSQPAPGRHDEDRSLLCRRP